MSNDTSDLTKYDVVMLAFLVLAGCGIRLYFLQFADVISADGISYISIAKDFISGRGLSAASHYPPFYPILLGLASVPLKDFETAGLAVSIVMGSLICVPIFLLGRDFFNKKTGLIAAILALTWPTLRYWSTNVMSQATYITLVLFGIYFLWNGYKKSSIFASISAGIFFACAHLTRSEGVLVLFTGCTVLLVFTFINRHSPKKLLYVVLSLGVFFIVFSPYLVMLHELTGKWQLTGKSKIAIADALSEYLGIPDIKHDPSFQEIGYLDLFRLYPDYIRTNYIKNIRTCWNDMLPLYGWILAAIGLVAGSAGRQKICERSYLLATFTPLGVIIVFFFIGPEYTQPYLPVLLLFIGNGIISIERWVALQGETGRNNLFSLYGMYIPILVIVLYGAWNVIKDIPADRNKPYIYTKDGGRFDDKRIGLRLKNILPEGAILMTRSGRIGYYSQHRFVTPPQADYDGIISFAKKNNVGYLIATVQLLNMRPRLEFLYGPILDPGRPFTPPPELELVDVAQEPGGLPYLVYRFK
jgi:4-amino-4-deoxy-L-arabinose transferase-like glycosyltransferase